MRKAFKKQRNQIGEINSQVEDTLLGIRVVKSFATEELEAEKFEDGNKKFLDTKKLGYFYMAGFLLYAFVSLSHIFHEAFHNHLTPREFFQTILLLLYLYF